MYLIKKEFYLFSLAPIVLLLFLIGIYRLDKLLLFISFCTPLSVSLWEMGMSDLSFNMFIPTEPLLFFVLLLFLFKLIYKKEFDNKISYHPISIIIYLYLLWILITSITSTDIIVSLKFFISRLWFVVAFYLLGTQLFKKTANIKTFLWAYILSFVIVIFYTWYNHYNIGMANENAAHFVMTPFYKDHTSYGAAIAMFIPVLFGFSFDKNNKLFVSLFSWLLLTVFLVALVFSYSRAAWISVIFAFVCWGLIKLRIRFFYIFLFTLLVASVLFLYRTEITIMLEQNRQGSTNNLSKHAQSITNITTDDSNMERINRWKCAMRMFKEKPVFGWGPGTYMFEYAPFQFSYDRTSISTNAGNRGNAHSEYIGPLAESGVLGMLTFLLIVIFVVYYGIKVYRNTADDTLKKIAISVLIGLITYFFHGTLNNFLDTDKASVPFWGFIGIIVAIDVYNRQTASK